MIDTLASVKALEAAGVNRKPEAQVEAMTRHVSLHLVPNVDLEWATRRQEHRLTRLRQDLTVRVFGLRLRIHWADERILFASPDG